jgi:hypothetical protein
MICVCVSGLVCVFGATLLNYFESTRCLCHARANPRIYNKQDMTKSCGACPSRMNWERANASPRTATSTSIGGPDDVLDNGMCANGSK